MGIKTAPLFAGIIIFLVSTQIFGIPYWWIAPIELSGVGPPLFSIEIVPKRPTSIGEPIFATVSSLSAKRPIENATITVMKNGDYIIELTTDKNGQVVLDYIGDITILKISKDGYKPKMIAIPESPKKWVTQTIISFITSILTVVIVQYILPTIMSRREMRNEFAV